MLRLLRIASLADGISFLILLGIAMPLKYVWERPEFVSWVGRIHGGLFVLLGLCTLACWIDRKWPITRPILIMFCAFVPFAPFWLDRKLREEATS